MFRNFYRCVRCRLIRAELMPQYLAQRQSALTIQRGKPRGFPRCFDECTFNYAALGAISKSGLWLTISASDPKAVALSIPPCSPARSPASISTAILADATITANSSPAPIPPRTAIKDLLQGFRGIYSASQPHKRPA